MAELWYDLKHGVRRLVRSRTFSMTVLLTLGLGIGATCAVFSVVHAVLLEPVPYPEPERLVLVQGQNLRDGAAEVWPISYPDFEDWLDRSESFETLAVLGSSPRTFQLGVEGDPRLLAAELVSEGYFDLLGQAPVVGRSFLPEETGKGAGHRVTVLSHELWRTEYGGAPGVIGDSILLDGQEYRVVGVMPPGFRGLSDRAELWVPVNLISELELPGFVDSRRVRWLSAVGRLAPGTSVPQARGEMKRLTSRLADELPETNEHLSAEVIPLTEVWVGDLRPALLALFGSTLFLLLIACANVANLLLVDSVRRERELAVRSTMGASPRRLAGQLLVESSALGLLGGGVGLLVASWVTRWLVRQSTLNVRSFVEIELDWTVVVVALGLSMLVGVLFGALPAWKLSRTAPTVALKEGGRGASRGVWGIQSGLIVLEVSLALVLLVGAGVLVQRFQGLLSTDLGFQEGGVLVLRLDLRLDDEARRRVTGRELVERAGSIPGVAEAALSGPAIPTDPWEAMYFYVDDGSEEAETEFRVLPYHAVSPGYFDLLDIPLLQGRAFGPGDGPSGEPVAVVSRALAERYWPGEDPLGKRLKVVPAPGEEHPWLRVVGVVADVRHGGLGVDDERPGPDVYMAIHQFPPFTRPVYNLLLRTEGIDPAAIAEPAERLVRSVAVGAPVYDVGPLEDRVGDQVANRRFLAVLMGLFAILALVLGALGIYGVISYDVVQQRRDIGIRLAVGATRPSILRRVIGRASLLVTIGLVVGIAGALALARVLESVVQGVEAGDWVTLIGAALFLAAVGVLASLAPALSAMRTDPRVVLSE